ncbi:SAM-dependent methyltransferase [Amycolatopsis rhabdoformis]|uniref:S-adenosyl-L-methionine-dependent methyltransferase n=1 Tax=Amycolatopsis rhabdoformis TaxID=1448059 RepID=A0ABZ1IA29_9PSEU|nr:SAM-dependent methyltransferase [Amycolatopsis rhabdoformis]WSE31280.1 SAM-dependent methyltransferase [Amycolatopsis rhabdoformis]
MFEVDSAPVLNLKDATAADARPAARRVSVIADLREDWLSTLAAHGFDRRRPTAWVAEGLLPYLTPPQADALLTTITAVSAPGSRFAGEYLSRPTRMTDLPMSDEQDRAVANVFVSADQGGPDVEPEKWLSAHGWTGEQVDFADELAAAGHELPALFDPAKPDPLRLWLFTGRL